MKNLPNNKNYGFKGVSTLDIFKIKTLLPFLFLVLLSNAAFGGHSILDAVDPTFNPQVETNSFVDKTVIDIISLPDGKILAAGQFNSYNRQPVGGLIRLNADATLDTTFNNTFFEAGSVPNKILLQADGKIIVRGYNLTWGGKTKPNTHIVRLNSDGTLDTDFNYNEGVNIGDITIDASGRVIVSGSFTENNIFRRIIRLNPNGSLDTTFQCSVTRSAGTLSTQNNKIIVNLSENSQQSVERLNEDGTIDTSFTPKNLNGFNATRIIVQPDNKIIILDTLHLLRINANGTDDVNFSTSLFSSQTKRMALSGDGRITIAVGTGPVQIRRFLADGSADASFSAYTATFYSSFAAQSDGSVILGDFIIGGGGITFQTYFLKLLPSGTPDSSFNAGGTGFQNVRPGSIRAIAVQPDGKVLLGGKFDAVNNATRFKIARLNTDSTVDSTFQISTGGTANYFSQIDKFNHVYVQTDGKILLSGNFNYVVNGLSKGQLVRLNADGSIDSTFNLGISILDTFGCCGGGTNNFSVLNNGKIIVGTSRLNNSPTTIPQKLNADGSLDTSFNPSVYSEQSVVFIMDLAVQPDGRIIIGGRSLVSNPSSSTTTSFILRLNADGTTDSTFQNSGETGKEITTLSLLPNGKILIVKGSPFTQTVQQSSILRLNSDGSIDNSFKTGTTEGRINTLLAVPTGKIFAGGKFTTFNGETRRNLVQISGDGNLNSTVYTLNDEVLSLAVDSEGRILVGGSFTVINAGGADSNRSYVARLIDSSLARKNTRFDFDGDGRADIAVFRNGNWYINQSSQGFTAVAFGVQTDRIVPADYDGDGKTDIAVFRSGNWYFLNSSNGFSAVQFGESTDIPQPADYDGDGRADIAVFRPSNGVWYILGSQKGFFAARFGANGDKPVAADYDGDGKADFAVFRNGYWYIQNSFAGFKAIQFGYGTDIPIAADYDGDGKTDIAVYRGGSWYILESGSGFRALQFGSQTDLPVAADYDGDGKTNIAVYRAGNWYVLNSSGNGFYGELFGTPTDQPIPSVLQ